MKRGEIRVKPTEESSRDSRFLKFHPKHSFKEYLLTGRDE